MVAAENSRLRHGTDAILFFNSITSVIRHRRIPRKMDRAVVAKDHPVREPAVGPSATPGTRFRLGPPAGSSRSEGPIG
jgi:hypothetical protein